MFRSKIELFTEDDGSVNIFGLHWNPVSDSFSHRTSVLTAQFTKRSVLSTIAKLNYDPIGALGPIIFWAKSFVQSLWQRKLQWGDRLPPTLHDLWDTFLQKLPLVSKIKIPRFVYWLTSERSQFKIFVTNRLAKIIELVPTRQWHHVPSEFDPADCVTRGAFPSQALGQNFYW